jgi:hypothetical protein
VAHMMLMRTIQITYVTVVRKPRREENTWETKGAWVWAQ